MDETLTATINKLKVVFSEYLDKKFEDLTKEDGRTPYSAKYFLEECKQDLLTPYEE